MSFLTTHIRNNMLEILLYTRRNELIGSSRSFINNKMAVLANLHVSDDFKYLGYGSHIIRETEHNLKTIFPIQTINLLAWQPSGGSEVIDFYKNHGFDLTDSKTETFDDYSQIFDLKRMHKDM